MSSFTEVTFTAGAGYEVAPGTTYHIRLDDAVADAAAYDFYLAQMTIGDEEDALGSGWEIAILVVSEDWCFGDVDTVEHLLRLQDRDQGVHFAWSDGRYGSGH